MNKIAWGLVILLSVVSLCGLSPLAGRVVEVRHTEAEAELTQSQTELTEAETSQESQRALSEVVRELLAELRKERESQRELIRLLLDLIREQQRPRYTWLWVLFIIIGGIVAVLLLRRRERIVVMMLPTSAQSPWLPVCSTDIVPWSELGAIQAMEMFQDGQEIAIE